MIKPGDSQIKKTLHELAKEFPDKTYRELEKYRDADRVEEAEKIPLTASQQKQEELEPIEDALGACITAGIKRDKAAADLQVMKRRAQEAEGELSILKGIETNRVKEAQAKSSQLQDALDNTKKENNDLYNRVADLTESLKSKDYFEKPDYKYLIEENRKLEQERNELQAENKKLHAYLEKRIDGSRESGM